MIDLFLNKSTKNYNCMKSDAQNFRSYKNYLFDHTIQFAERSHCDKVSRLCLNIYLVQIFLARTSRIIWDTKWILASKLILILKLAFSSRTIPAYGSVWQFFVKKKLSFNHSLSPYSDNWFDIIFVNYHIFRYFSVELFFIGIGNIPYAVRIVFIQIVNLWIMANCDKSIYNIVVNK